jgi:hypothetical protein
MTFGLKSSGTKAHSMVRAKELFRPFDAAGITTVLGHGDLAGCGVGHRHAGPLLALARKLWPRGLIRRFHSGSHCS